MHFYYCVMKWEVCRQPLLRPAEVLRCLEKLSCEIQTKLAVFLMETHLQLKEWLTVNLWLFRLWYLVTNWQKWSASVQSRKTTDMFAANDKIRVREFRIMENLSSPLWTSQLPNKLKNSLMRLVVVLTNMIFLDFIEWIMSTFGSSAYLGEPIFSEWLMHAVRIN